MMILTGTFVVFLVIGFLRMRRSRLERKEKTLFVLLSFLGFALWVSLKLHKPVDVNQGIAWLVKRMF